MSRSGKRRTWKFASGARIKASVRVKKINTCRENYTLHMLKFLPSIVLSFLFTCALQAQDNRPVLSALPQKPVVEIIYMQEERPVNAEKISDIIINPNSSHCGIKELLEHAVYQASLKGGNAIYISSIRAPG